MHHLVSKMSHQASIEVVHESHHLKNRASKIQATVTCTISGGVSPLTPWSGRKITWHLWLMPKSYLVQCLLGTLYFHYLYFLAVFQNKFI